MAVFPSGIATNADLYVALDNFGTTLNGAITDSQTTITLTSTTGLPTVGILTIGAEKVQYTGVSGFDITGCTRGFSSTIAAAHADASTVEFNVVEEHHNGLKDEIIAVETHLGTNGANVVHITGSETITGIKTINAKTILGASQYFTAPLAGFFTVNNSGDTLNYLQIRDSDGQSQFVNGSATDPALAFISDTDTGIYRFGANVLGFTSGGVNICTIGTNFGMVSGVIRNTDGSVGSPSYTFEADSDSGIYRVGANSIGVAVNGVLRFTVGSGATTNAFNFLPDATASLRDIGSPTQLWQNLYATGIVGTTTNNDAAAGNVGEFVRSSQPTPQSSPGSGQFFDITSITLSAGDWDISGIVVFTLNGATQTVALMAITSTSGNSTTGQIDGDNRCGVAVPVTGNDTSGSIPGYRVSLSGSTTYYLKARMNFSAGTPQAFGRISARRAR